MEKSTRLLIIILFAFLITAYIPLQTAQEEPVYQDDFEKYIGNADLLRAYYVWEEGAILQVDLVKDTVHSGEKALRVELVSPNPRNNSINASIYSTLPFLHTNWSEGTGVRFWIANENDIPLTLTFNFKEKYNEYWSVSSSGVYFLQSDEGDSQQKNIVYGNLIVPADFQGFVMIPFLSFSVPEWNTARGNEIMELDSVDSYAFGVTLGQKTGQVFIIDDFEVITQADYKTLEILGTNSIEIPASGEHLEFYTARLTSLREQSSEIVSVHWSVVEPVGEGIVIDEDGELTIPADIQASSVILSALYTSDSTSITNEFMISLTGGKPLVVVEPAIDTPAVVEVVESNYDRFSKNFEVWARENRTIFVIVIIGIVTIFLAILSQAQRKLK